MDGPVMAASEGNQVQAAPPPPSSSTASPSVRKDFPETWIWDEISSDGLVCFGKGIFMFYVF